MIEILQAILYLLMIVTQALIIGWIIGITARPSKIKSFKSLFTKPSEPTEEEQRELKEIEKWKDILDQTDNYTPESMRNKRV